jgi:RsiW-degrading membrane proteinase PrsW (M82 family)
MMKFPPYIQPQLTGWDHYSNVMILLAGFAVVLFTFTYGAFFNWRATRSGQAVLGFVAGLVAILWFTIITKATGGDWPYRDIIKACIYTYVFASTLGLLWTLISNWLQGNNPIDLRQRERRVPSSLSRLTSRRHKPTGVKMEPHKDEFDDISQ